MPNPCEDLEDLAGTTTEVAYTFDAIFIDTMASSETIALYTWATIENIVNATEEVTDSWFTQVIDSVATATTHPDSYVEAYNALVNSVLATTSNAASGIYIAHEDTVTLTETLDLFRYYLVADAVTTSTEAVHTIVTTQAVINTLAAGDVFAAGVSEAIEDAVSAVDVVGIFAFATENVVDSVAGADTWGSTFVLAIALLDTVGTSTTTGQALVAQQAITDTVTALERFWARGNDQLAWQVNLETTAANWHTNYGFESVVQYGDSVFAVSEDGIYLMTGDTDAGAPISAYVKTGFMDFSSPRLKRMEGVYFGYHGGQMNVTVDTYGYPGGSNSFSMPAKTVNAPGSNRVVPGKGLVSRYWRVTVANVGGAYFDVDNIEFDVAASTTRRT